MKNSVEVKNSEVDNHVQAVAEIALLFPLRIESMKRNPGKIITSQSHSKYN